MRPEVIDVMLVMAMGLTVIDWLTGRMASLPSLYQLPPKDSLMGATDWAGVIVAVTGLLVAFGAGMKWLIGFIEKQADKTIAAKDDELDTLKQYVKVLEMVNERRDS